MRKVGHKLDFADAGQTRNFGRARRGCTFGDGGVVRSPKGFERALRPLKSRSTYLCISHVLFSLVCRSLPTPLTSAVAAAARSLSEAVSSSYGRSPSQDVIDFYTKMSDTVLLAMFFLPLISLAVLGVQTLLDSGKVSKEEMKQRDEDEEAMIKAKAAESLYAPGDVKGGTV